MKQRIIAISGPTASGKTDLSIEIAQQLKTEIISFDSRQFYTELNIGVARPSPAQLSQVKHHFIASTSIHKPYTAISFCIDARKRIDALLEKNECVVLCGGTGLYLKALLKGLSTLPETQPAIREQVELLWQKKGLPGLLHLIEKRDQQALKQVETHNPARLKRVAELLLSAENKSLQEIYSPKMNPIEHTYQIFNLIPEKEILYKRIAVRTDAMIASGLLSEVQALIPHKELPLLKTVGYTELFHYLDGNCTREEAIDKIKQHTRNYAKRQITWFKNQTEGIVLNGENTTNRVVSFMQN